MPAQPSANRYLLLLVFSQFAGTSLWFAGNAVVDKISPTANSAALTSYVQFGFIAGTLVFSLFTIADRYSARKVFFVSCIMAALANICILPFHHLPFVLPLLRLCTGFFLAGIYPVGMKIAADVFPQQLGKALGFLVGALVLGTAFPHFVRSQLGDLRWQTVLAATSALAVIGGCLVYNFIPLKQKTATLAKPDFTTVFRIFQNPSFRAAAFGYFGHMWELYAFWALLPELLSSYNSTHQMHENLFWWSFLSIGSGSAGCVVGGWLSQKWGSKNVAMTALFLSGLCCLVSPLAFAAGSSLFLSFLLFWGFAVVTDSPQFSALIAKAATEKNKGTALTIVTCIGFAITIVSIQLLRGLFLEQKEYALWMLAPGPFLGLLSLKLQK